MAPNIPLVESAEIEALKKSLKWGKYDGPTCTIFISNHVQDAEQKAGLKNESYFETPKSLDKKLNPYLDPFKILQNRTDAISKFRAVVLENKDFLDNEASFSSNPRLKNENSFYYFIKAVDTTQQGIIPIMAAGPIMMGTVGEVPARIYYFNPFYVVCQKLYTINHDLQTAFNSNADPADKVLTLWRTLEWHRYKDPNFYFIDDLPYWINYFSGK